MLTLQRHHDAGRASSPTTRMRSTLPILIQVPAIDVRASRRPSGAHVGLRKRRLRKEVKLVGLGFLLSLPLALLALSPLAGWANSVSESTEPMSQLEFASPMPSFIVSDQAISSPSSASTSSPASIETIPTITLQGFVLPDREVEESNHAGG